jgi:hypothetical protein
MGKTYVMWTYTPQKFTGDDYSGTYKTTGPTEYHVGLVHGWVTQAVGTLSMAGAVVQPEGSNQLEFRGIGELRVLERPEVDQGSGYVTATKEDWDGVNA